VQAPGPRLLPAYRRSTINQAARGTAAPIVRQPRPVERRCPTDLDVVSEVGASDCVELCLLLIIVFCGGRPPGRHRRIAESRQVCGALQRGTGRIERCSGARHVRKRPTPSQSAAGSDVDRSSALDQPVRARGLKPLIRSPQPSSGTPCGQGGVIRAACRRGGVSLFAAMPESRTRSARPRTPDCAAHRRVVRSRLLGSAAFCHPRTLAAAKPGRLGRFLPNVVGCCDPLCWAGSSQDGDS